MPLYVYIILQLVFKAHDMILRTFGRKIRPVSPHIVAISWRFHPIVQADRNGFNFFYQALNAHIIVVQHIWQQRGE